jgi:hypothetical protein
LQQWGGTGGGARTTSNSKIESCGADVVVSAPAPVREPQWTRGAAQRQRHGWAAIGAGASAAPWRASRRDVATVAWAAQRVARWRAGVGATQMQQ